jgi:hypothetical protein
MARKILFVGAGAMVHEVERGMRSAVPPNLELTLRRAGLE